MKKGYFIILILLLVLVNGLLLRQSANLRKIIKANSTKALQLEERVIPDFILYDRDGKEYNSRTLYNDDRYRLFFLFNLTNCAFCSTHRESLSALIHIRYLEVLGIVNHEDKTELNRWIDNENLPFSILYDESGVVTDAFNMPVSPFFILTDGEGLKIYAAMANEGSLQFILKTYLSD